MIAPQHLLIAPSYAIPSLEYERSPVDRWSISQSSLATGCCLWLLRAAAIDVLSATRRAGKMSWEREQSLSYLRIELHPNANRERASSEFSATCERSGAEMERFSFHSLSLIPNARNPKPLFASSFPSTTLNCIWCNRTPQQNARTRTCRATCRRWCRRAAAWSTRASRTRGSTSARAPLT